MPTWKSTQGTVIPVMRYNDANAAIEWLCAAFGFEKRLVVSGPSNTIVHAQLTFGNGMIMLGTVREGEGNGAPEAGTCLIVNNADEVYARARAAGATVIREIEDQEYGGRAFSCSDPEGHIWHVGTYDPWGE